MNIIEKLKVKVWSVNPYPLATRLKRGCPLCRAPIVLADGEQEKINKDMERKLDILEKVDKKNPKALMAFAKSGNPFQGVKFHCTREECPFNE